MLGTCAGVISARTPRRADANVVVYVTATGGSAIKAVEVILEHGVPEERIIFINLVRTAPVYGPIREGLACMHIR